MGVDVILPSKKAIVMFGTSLVGGGGAERRFARVYEKLCEKGENVLLFTNESLYLSMLDAGVLRPSDGVIRFPGSYKNPITLSFWLIKTCWIYKVDILHLVIVQRMLLPFYFFLWAGGLGRMKVVSTVALSTLGAGVTVPLGLRFVTKLIWDRADAIDSLYSRFTERYSKQYPGKITTTPCSFTDYDMFYPARCKQPWVVFCGRLSPGKRPLLFVDAVAELCSRHEADLQEAPWHFYVLGSGPLTAQVAARIESLGLSDRVTVKSVVNSAPFLRESSIFVSIQDVENYPSQSLLEAMASENCVVVSDVGETRRLVDETRGVLVGSQPNAQEIADALWSVMVDADRRIQLAAGAREFGRRFHTVDVFAEYLIHLWNQVSALV